MKTLAEIAIEAGLVTKAGAAKAGRLSEERKQPLVVILIRELHVDEVSLIGALRKQTRVPLLDPATVQVDPESLRLVPRDSCARLRVLPIGVSFDGKTRVLRVAMADPTDTAAILELEVIANCEIEVTALPLSAIEELVEQGYQQFSTAVTRAPRSMGSTLSVASRSKPRPIEGSRARPAEGSRGRPVEGSRARPVEGADGEKEHSVTAQIPLSSLGPPPAELELRLAALISVLQHKGLVTEAELAEALKRLDGKPSES